MSELIISLIVLYWVFLILTNQWHFKMPNTNIEIGRVEPDPVPVADPSPKVSDTEERRKAKNRAKKKRKKKRKKLSKLKADCVMALRSLGVKASEAPAQVERVFKKNKNIKSVEEFIRSM